MNNYELAVHHKHPHFCENYPVESPQLNDFWVALKKKVPELILHSADSSARTSLLNEDGVNRTDILLARKLAVAHVKNPSEKIGSIEYDRYDEKYVVWSRLICNEKFSRWNSENHSQRSKHMDKMIKVAVKVLIPKQIKEVWGENRDNFLRNISYVRDSANEGMRKNVNNIAMNTWRQEIMNMVEQGYVPKTESVKKALEYVVQTKDEYEYLSTYDPPKAFVWIKPDGVAYQRFTAHTQPNGEDINVPSTEHLPEDIKSKVMVLSMCDEGKFIGEVGMKESDTRFWVIV